MLVLSMNSKRQRRPNVRLGEVGDVPAASACGFPHRIGDNFGQRRWGGESSLISEKIFPEFVVSDTQFSPMIPSEMLRNIENNNPNSSKLSFDRGPRRTKTANSELGFGGITRKSRKRRVRGGFAGGWMDSRHSPSPDAAEFIVENEDKYIPINDSKDFSDQDTSATTGRGLAEKHWKIDAHCRFGEAEALPESLGGMERMKTRCALSSVCSWLEELGFGKYAGIFEMHGVDEEALPLLTFADLKEIGVFAVGHRRKLYTAIQQLRGSS